MRRPLQSFPPARLLGIECGATRTRARLVVTGADGPQDWEGGPSNLRLLSDAQLRARFREVARALPHPTAVAIGMAGVRTAGDVRRITRLVDSTWPRVPCHVTNDLEPALAAAPTPAGGAAAARVLVLSGTGSCCLAISRNGRRAKLGGWGHILGDKGSAYEIGLRALKAVVYYLDRDGEWSSLGEQLLRRLLLNEPNDLIPWVQSATKDQVAALAREVFDAAAHRDPIARDILRGAAASLAGDALACAARVTRVGQPVQFVLAGSVLLHGTGLARELTRRLRAGWPGAQVTPLRQPAVAGLVEMARLLSAGRGGNAPQSHAPAVSAPGPGPVPEATGPSPTEQRNPRTRNLDRMPLRQAIRAFLAEDARIPAAVGRCTGGIERAVKAVTRAFRTGGRLLYVGAGTSGRLGVLDASECPPTFRSPPGWVQGIIAGGQQALWSSIEGAEDDVAGGERAMQFRRVMPRDVVVGIAASGRTPFVWGALAEARRRGATTVLLCCNPHLRFRRGLRPDIVLAVDVGPEPLTGSTRLKSGTATKLVLNLLTTLSMVRLGKVAGNLMIDLNPSNTKLRGRAVRILVDLTGADPSACQAALERSGWRVKEAWQALRRGRRPGSGPVGPAQNPRTPRPNPPLNRVSRNTRTAKR